MSELAGLLRQESRGHGRRQGGGRREVRQEGGLQACEKVERER